MNARLEANLLRDWRPGWRTGVLMNIADTSAIPDRRRRMRNRRAWRSLFRVLLLAFVVMAAMLFRLT